MNNPFKSPCIFYLLPFVLICQIFSKLGMRIIGQSGLLSMNNLCSLRKQQLLFSRKKKSLQPFSKNLKDSHCLKLSRNHVGIQFFSKLSWQQHEYSLFHDFFYSCAIFQKSQKQYWALCTNFNCNNSLEGKSSMNPTQFLDIGPSRRWKNGLILASRMYDS